MTGNDSSGYRVRGDLRERWPAAAPVVRHAIRNAPEALPGGSALEPLTRSAATREEIAAGVDGLLGLLQEAGSTFQRPDDRVGTELSTLARWLMGLRYQARHPVSRVDGDPRPGSRPVLGKVRAEVGERMRGPDTSGERGERAVLERHRRIALAADRLHRRNRRAAARGATIHDSGARSPPPDEKALSASQQAQAQAHAALKEARDAALARAVAGGMPLHRRDALVRRADGTLLARPGADPTRAEVFTDLARVRAELQRLRRELGSDPADEVVETALLALEEHARIDEAAWATLTWRTWGGWRRMRRAQEAAAEVRRKLATATIPTRATTGDVIPAAGDDGTLVMGGGPIAGAAATVRGLGQPMNQDTATLGRSTDGSASFAVVADGLSAGLHSEQAAQSATAAARAVLEAHRVGDDPAETVRRAYQAAADAVAALDQERAANPAATTLVVALVVPSPTTPARYVAHIAWVGDSRAYWVPSTGDAVALTTDHARSGALIGWLASDSRPEPGITSREIDDGALVLLTDGLWDRADPSTLSPNGRADARAAVTELFAAAAAGGRGDDQTAAVLAVPGSPGPATPPGGTPAPTPGSPGVDLRFPSDQQVGDPLKEGLGPAGATATVPQPAPQPGSGGGRRGSAGLLGAAPLLGDGGGWPAEVVQTVVQLGLAGLVAAGVFLGVRWLVGALNDGRSTRAPPLRRLGRIAAGVAAGVVLLFGGGAGGVAAVAAEPASSTSSTPLAAAQPAEPGRPEVDERTRVAGRADELLERVEALKRQFFGAGAIPEAISRLGDLQVRVREFSTDAESARISDAAERIGNAISGWIPTDLYPYYLRLDVMRLRADATDPGVPLAELWSDADDLAADIDELERLLDARDARLPGLRAELAELEQRQDDRETDRLVQNWLVAGALVFFAGSGLFAAYRWWWHHSSKPTEARPQAPSQAPAAAAYGHSGFASAEQVLDAVASFLATAAGSEFAAAVGPLPSGTAGLGDPLEALAAYRKVALSRAERFAIEKYTDDHGIRLNDALRRGKRLTLVQRMIVKGILSAATKHTTGKPMIVTRAFRPNDVFPLDENFAPGFVHQDEGVGSTSYWITPFTGRIRWTVYLPAGVNLIPVESSGIPVESSGVGQHGYEREFVLPPGTTFAVVSDVTENIRGESIRRTLLVLLPEVRRLRAAPEPGSDPGRRGAAGSLGAAPLLAADGPLADIVQTIAQVGLLIGGAAVAAFFVVRWVVRALSGSRTTRAPTAAPGSPGRAVRHPVNGGPTARIVAALSRLARSWTALSTRLAEGAASATDEGHDAGSATGGLDAATSAPDRSSDSADEAGRAQFASHRSSDDGHDAQHGPRLWKRIWSHIKGLVLRDTGARAGSPSFRSWPGPVVPLASAAVVVVWAAVGMVWQVPVPVGFVAFAAWGALDMFAALGWDARPAVRRVLTSAVALNWLVDLAIDLPAALAGGGIAAWVGAVFAVADLSFLVAALPAAWAAWTAVEDHSRRPSVVWIQRWVAFPSVTAAIGLLGLQMILEGPTVAAVPLAVAVAGFAYQTGLHLRAVPGAGTSGRGGRVAMFVGGAGLAIYGMLRLALDHPITAVVTGAVGGATAMLLWVLNRRGPPPS